MVLGNFPRQLKQFHLIQFHSFFHEQNILTPPFFRSYFRLHANHRPGALQINLQLYA
jgi:hypothetical protein